MAPPGKAVRDPHVCRSRNERFITRPPRLSHCEGRSAQRDKWSMKGQVGNGTSGP